MASGFRHVDPDDYEPALFQVKGRRNVRVSQVRLLGCGIVNLGMKVKFVRDARVFMNQNNLFCCTEIIILG